MLIINTKNKITLYISILYTPTPQLNQTIKLPFYLTHKKLKKKRKKYIEIFVFNQFFTEHIMGKKSQFIEFLQNRFLEQKIYF